jgi:uncharacterized protein involved in outer membrane biogenesis
VTLAEQFNRWMGKTGDGLRQAMTGPGPGRRIGRPVIVVAGVLLLLAVMVYVVLAQTNWNWLRGPIGRFASARTGRQVSIGGNLTAHLLTFTPRIEVGGLKVGNPAWAGPGDVVDVAELKLQVKALPLLIGRLELPLVDLESPRIDLVRDLSGQENWVLGAPTGKATKLPPINRFLIANGSLRLTDAQRKIVFNGKVQASETAGAAGGRGFALTGEGALNQEPFVLLASGGPLIEVKRDQPYPFHLDAHSGSSRVVLDAQIERPFDFGQISGTMAIKGPDLARLYDLTAITLPNTPPYSLSAHFVRRQSFFQLTQLVGSIGASDLEGQMSINRIDGRRKLDADLSSRKLELADLIAVIGGEPKTKGAVQAVAAPSGRMMPDAPLYKDRLRAMDADVRYRADAVRGAGLPLTRGDLTLKLDHGVLTLDPLSLDLSQGRLAGRVRIDGRQSTVKTDIDLTLANVALAQFLKGKNGSPPPFQGMLQARAQLHGEGDSVHKAAATANGRVAAVVPHGEVRQAFAELLGINVAHGLYLLLYKDDKQTNVRCAVADFDVKNGVMQANPFVIDTGVVTATGSGTIDLGAETLDMKLKGKPKKVELLRIWAPITLTGTLSKPKLGVDAGAVAAQGGAAVAATAVLGPLAVILPFVSAGLAKDADCAGLIADAKTSGAPVKLVKLAPAATAARHR